jgi:hypothetical protein
VCHFHGSLALSCVVSDYLVVACRSHVSRVLFRVSFARVACAISRVSFASVARAVRTRCHSTFARTARYPRVRLNGSLIMAQVS